jgi:uncharacterized protein
LGVRIPPSAPLALCAPVGTLVVVTEAGTVSSIWRFPVKSMLGEELQEAKLTDRGVSGDRAYALVDDETGNVVSVKRPKVWGRMFEIRATTIDGVVTVHLPDGSSFAIDDPGLVTALCELFGRKVSVTDTAPEAATFEEAWLAELKEDARPYFGMPSHTQDGEEFIDAPVSMGVPGGLFDFGAIHLVTSSTERALSSAAPGSRFDARRFRPNIVIDTPDEGFVETGWVQHTLRVGDVELPVSMSVPRCVMTTLAQDDLPADREVLRTITRVNKVEFAPGSPFPCVGVYADAPAGGTIRVGDTVELLD